MKETIRAARAFFGPGMADTANPDDDEPAVTAELPQGAEVLPDTPAHADGEDETASHAVAAEPEPAEPVAVPPVTPDGPAVARVHRLSTLSMLDAATEQPPAMAEDEESNEESTETLLAEIACEIVEDALVAREEPELVGESDVQHAIAPEEPDEPAGEHARPLIDEDVEDDPMLAFDNLGKAVSDASAGAAPEEAAAMPATHAVEPVDEDDEDKATGTMPLRRDRHPGPRLPIDGLAHPSAATGTGPRTARGRPVGSPKWSASARHHMSDMLATSSREPAPIIRGRSGVELPRIDLSPDRHRQSSAMILLGLPAMLLVGFGAAYVYHASTYDPARVFDEARNAIPASIASIPGIGTAKPTRKISESIIQKQEETVAATPARAEPLPPPVAPPLGDPTTSRAAPAAPQATRTAKVETQPVAKTPDRVPDSARIEPAAAPVTSALMVTPAEQARAEPDLPKPVAPEPLTPEPANETTVGILPVPTTEPAAPEQTAPEQAKPADSAGNEPSTEATRMAALVPDSLPLSEETGETGQLIARGNERMEIGDIAAARLLFELAAESGSPVAATAMGRSYDPVYFIRVGVRGVKPDAAKAKDWYERAVSGGDRTAEKDLQNLTAWLTKQ